MTAYWTFAAKTKLDSGNCFFFQNGTVDNLYQPQKQFHMVLRSVRGVHVTEFYKKNSNKKSNKLLCHVTFSKDLEYWRILEKQKSPHLI